MNKKITTLGVSALMFGALLITPTADAFWGGGQDKTPESFTSFQQMVQSFTSWDDFKEAMKVQHEERKSERDAMKEKISHEAAKTDTGVIMTVTTDDADALEKMKERHEKMSDRENKNENVTRTVVELSNGFQTTITTNDADTLTRLHERADDGWGKMGRHGKRGQGMRNGNRGEGKRGHGKRMERTQE